MSTNSYLSEETLVRRGLEALMKALGPVETARFLNLPKRGYKDYVQWRREWQAGLNAEELLDEAFGPKSTTEQQGQ